jgi:hypothetical protein
MKKLFTILILCLTAVGFGQEPYMKPMLGRQINYGRSFSEGIVGFLLMNEGTGSKVYDISGYGRHCSFGTGAASPTWSGGKFGTSLYFDGGDYIQTPDVTTTNQLGAVVFWIKSNLSGTQAYIGEWHAANLEWMIYSVGTTLQLATTGGGSRIPTTITANEWHQIVFTGDSSRYDLYVDGVQRTGETRALDFSDDIEIGRQDGNGNYVVGYIDHILLYDRILTASEVQQLYIKPFCMFKEDLPIAMMYNYGAAAAPSGQVIFIQMSAIPLILIPALVFMFRRTNAY